MTTARRVWVVVGILLGSWLFALLLLRVFTIEPPEPEDDTEQIEVPDDDPAAVALLQSALDGLAGGYAYTSTIRQQGQVTIEVEGVQVGERSQRTVRSGGTTQEVISLPWGRWERTGDGEWNLVPVQDDVVDPLSALRQAKAVTFLDDDSLNALFRSGAFGAGTPATAATIHLGDDGSVELVYLTGSGGNEIDVTTVLRPEPDVTIEEPD